MCGIFGFIGKSKNPQVTYDLATQLFLKTEIRGTDATGFYALQPGDGQIIMDREPVKANEYVKKDIWNGIFHDNQDVDCFIGHCRQTSVGGGPERINKNNHPHWSDDRRVAVTHNGKIPEFSALKGRYDVESECDSEILLRMFESAKIITKDQESELVKDFPTLPPFLAERLTGLKEIFSRVNYGAMAVAIAERGDDNQRYIWLFRDDERPLHVVDLRDTLGQVFYCSTAEIWRNAIDACPSVTPFIEASKTSNQIIEFPAFQIWLLNLDPSKSVVGENGALEQGEDCWNIRKFKITKTKYIDWKENEDEDDKQSFKRAPAERGVKPVAQVLTRLGFNDVIKETPKLSVPDEEIENDKKKVDEISSEKALESPPIKAQVQPVKSTGRDPGDESEYEVNTGSNNEPVLKNSKAVNTPEPEEGVIDLDAFDQIKEDILKKIAKLSAEIHSKAQDHSLPGRNFSQVIDSMEQVRGEIDSALGVLTAK